MKRIYVSGKVTGLDKEYAKSLFWKAEKFLESQGGCQVINPMRYIQTTDVRPWEWYMLKDIELIFTCTDMFMLNNWRDSKGARIEHAIVKELELNIVYE